MPSPTGTVVHKDYWNSQKVEIKDHGNFRSLYFDNDYLQSRMALNSPEELVLTYTWYMAFSLLLLPNPTNILVIGVGSGSLIRFFHHHYPDCKIDAVDKSLHIIKLARGYFCLPDNPNISIHCQDGFDFIKSNSNKRYDLILIDAFDSQGMAKTIYSTSFFQECVKSLLPQGIISCNLWSTNTNLFQSVKNSLLQEIPYHLVLPVPNRGNCVILALNFQIPWVSICLNKKKQQALAKRYSINFSQMIRIAKQNNLSLKDKLSLWVR